MNSENKNIWIIAGEASGDLYGAKLANELRAIGAAKGVEVTVKGMGGPEMKKANVDILVDSTELGVVGLIEVFKHIFTFIKIFFSLVKRAKQEKPDAIILIDYPGFNLLFARKLYKTNIPIIWYISPHVWTWGKRRIPKLAKFCRKMLVIFPFETEIYQKHGLDTSFVGHPLVDIVEERKDKTIERDANTVLLLPGSRKMEIKRLLQPMLEAAVILQKKHPELQFVISTPRPKALQQCKDIVEAFAAQFPEIASKVELSCGKTPYWQQRAATGIAASGTVTVESAIAGLPLVVAYKLNGLTLLVASLVVRLYRGFFTMVNIIANKEVFREFLQWRASAKNLAEAVEKILPDGEERQQVEKDMHKVCEELSQGSTSAIKNAAQECFKIAECNQ